MHVKGIILLCFYCSVICPAPAPGFCHPSSFSRGGLLGTGARIGVGGGGAGRSGGRGRVIIARNAVDHLDDGADRLGKEVLLSGLLGLLGELVLVGFDTETQLIEER